MERQHLMIGFLMSFFSGCASASPYAKSDHFDGERFYNPSGTVVKSFWQVLKWQATSNKTAWPEWRELTAKPALTHSGPEGTATVTFVNHATHLIQTPRCNTLTDPVFFERVSPVSWAGPKRKRPPGVLFEELPKIQLVVISHNHYDHLDARSIEALAKAHNPQFIVPLGNAALLKEFGAKRVLELDWWQTEMLPELGVSVTLVPAQHWSARGLRDRNLALWGGYVLKEASGLQVYFAGDTGYGPHFRQIRERLGVMDLSLIPIGAYAPRWFMKEQHTNPDEAIQAHLDLESRFSMATHFGTFPLADDGMDEPVLDLKAALAARKLDDSHFYAPEHGETRVIRLHRP